jgi:hypothetical protein
MQQRQQQVQGAKEGERRGSKAAGAAQHRAELAELRRKYTHRPIGGPEAARPEQQNQQQQQHAAPQQQAVAPLLPGRLKELKRRREQAALRGELEGFSSSDDEGGAAPAAPPTKRHKALPGRLRKKLAKQRSSGSRPALLHDS